MTDFLSKNSIDHRCQAPECATKDTHILEARCANCRWVGEIRVTVGHEAAGTRSTAPCPQCRRSIRNGTFVRREDRAA